MRVRHLLLPLVLLPIAGMAPKPITLHLAGDSTMAQKLIHRRPETGWGEALQQYFDLDRVRVENHARNGRSTRSFLAEGRWQALVDRLQEGDYVFIQFGHNDAAKNRPDRYAPPEEYRRNLVRFVEDVRAKKANPVLLTPVCRRQFDGAGRFVDTHGEYPDIVRAVAKELDVPLIDMHRKSAEVLQRFGPEASKRLFLQLARGEHPNYPDGVVDNTHFSPLGAEIMAALAVQGIQELGLGLAEHLSEAARERAAAVASTSPPKAF